MAKTPNFSISLVSDFYEIINHMLAGSGLINTLSYSGCGVRTKPLH